MYYLLYLYIYHLANLSSLWDDLEDIDGNIIRPDKETSKKIKDLYTEIVYIFYNDRDLVEKTFKQIAQKEISEEFAYLDV